MTVYDIVLFLDADTCVQNSLDGLVNVDLGGKIIGVAKDARNSHFSVTLNNY